MTRPSIARRLPALLGASALLAGSSAGALPPEGACPAMSARPGAPVQEDAVPTALREGMLLGFEDLLSLRALLPPEIWRHREQFFFEGMQMVIGPCHRRYPVPSRFAAATREFAGRARVDESGNLHGYVAGVPFPPDSIDLSAPEAGVEWAWNLQERNRGPGVSGKFRLADMPAGGGATMVYEGTFFYVRTAHRADLAATDYRLPEGGTSAFVAGGRFEEPTSARELAWKQLRPSDADLRYAQSDDTFVYVPSMRKMRRAPTSWVDGVYTPRYRVSGDSRGGGIPVGGGGDYSGSGVIAPAAGESIATAEHIRQGFSDLALRPNAYVWRVLGEREVLAPINSASPGYPEDPHRNFGPSGLSVASDRWDVRWAVVIEGLARERGQGFDAITFYVDYQTQLPLYVATKTRSGRLLEIGIPVHRFSGDQFDYPEWPDGERILVFDPVAAVFFNAATGGSGWRRESYGVRSLPLRGAELMRMLSPDQLLRGH